MLLLNDKPCFNATLNNGQRYTLMIAGDSPEEPQALEFERDKPVPVSEAVKAYLEEHAVGTVTERSRSGRPVLRNVPKFEFTELKMD